MKVLTTVPPGFERGVIWEGDDGQQVLGPQIAELELIDPDPELSPFPLQLIVALVDGRYEITKLILRADRYANEQMDALRHDGDRINRGTRSETVPAITARGVGAVSLPAILRDGLYGKCWPRFRNELGDMVEGVGRGDELPITYVLARAIGENPTQAVAKALGITPGAAAQRVARARRDGRIPATTKGAR